MGVDCFYPHDNPPAVVMNELDFRKSKIIRIVTENPGLSRVELKNKISFHGAADLIAAMVKAGELRQEEIATGKRPRLELYPVTSKEEPVVEPSPRPEPKKPSPAKKMIVAGAVYENGQAPGEYDL